MIRERFKAVILHKIFKFDDQSISILNENFNNIERKFIELEDKIDKAIETLKEEL